MKVKLLKKIRKRYSIVRYDDIGTSPSDWIKECKDKIGVPFYVLYDKQTSLGLRNTASFEYSYLVKRIGDYVRRDYTHKIKNRRQKTEKVWYTSNQNTLFNDK